MSIFHYQEDPGYLKRLSEALRLSKEEITEKIDETLGRAESPITEVQLEDLEQILISADIGVRMTMQIIERIREETRGPGLLTSQKVRRMLREELLHILKQTGSEPDPGLSAQKPQVILVVGVNGVGKTTTIGKLAHRLHKEGNQVLICASDTFRAAAIEQLLIWAERAESGIVKHAAGADPAAVLFDALGACKAQNKDVLIVDTAGRLHTKAPLMQELAKMKRVAGREVPEAPHHVYLVLDATTGQNGLIQAREFLKAAEVTAIIVAKLDGTAKGGIVVAIAQELKLPIAYVGIGEKIEDLIPFSPEAFVDSLIRR